MSFKPHLAKFFIKQRILRGKAKILGVEIGTIDGVNAAHLLEEFPVLRLHCIAPLTSKIASQNIRAYPTCFMEFESLPVEVRASEDKDYAKASSRLKKFSGRATIERNGFICSQSKYVDESLDFIFVDVGTCEWLNYSVLDKWFSSLKIGGWALVYNVKIVEVKRALWGFAEVNKSNVGPIRSLGDDFPHDTFGGMCAIQRLS